MRPSSEQGIAAVLDTLPECKVVLDALDDNSYPKDPTGPTIDDFINSTGVRFRQQTQYEPRPPHASAYIELAWKVNPEFKIELRDVDYVKLAAQRILNQKRLTERAFNFATKRTLAARTIIATLPT